ncbi:MAG: serine hydrolase [Clostridia bacterium]|nr:serine hydrolase [Clostridia bacterium]
MKSFITKAAATLFTAALILGFIAGGVSSVFNADGEGDAVLNVPSVMQSLVGSSDTEPAGDAPITENEDKYDSIDIPAGGVTPPANSIQGSTLMGGVVLPELPGNHTLMGDESSATEDTTVSESESDTEETTVSESEVVEEEPEESEPVQVQKPQPVKPSMNTAEIINLLLSRSYTGGIDTFGNISGDTSALYNAIHKGSNISGFVAIRLSDGASIAYNPTRSFRCASAFKSFVSHYAYKQAAAGVLDLNAGITYTSADYYSGSGIIKSSPFGTVYSLRQVADYSIRYSDNAGFVMLQRYLNRDGLVDYAKSLGCPGADGFKYTWPDMSALDAAIWWADIYGFAKSSTYGAEAYNVYLNATQPSIKKGLNDEHPVAHKSGSMSYYFHDCGVVESEDPYILVLLTYNPNNYSSNNQTYFSGVVQEIDKLINP